jgi:nicotinamidase/pyrazinamidase
MHHRLAFLDVDTQADFMLPSGALYVPGAETIIPNLRALMHYARAHGILVISSADAHAPDDPSFAQWPPHCVSGTPGQLRIPETQLRSPLIIPNRPGFFKGPLPDRGQMIIEKIDYDVSSNLNFDAVVQTLGPRHFVAFGVATEFCVRASVLALMRQGFSVDVVSDTVKGITEEGHQNALREMRDAGVQLVTTADILSGRIPGHL